MAHVTEFLATSQLADKIKFSGEVVVYRESMSGDRISGALQDGMISETDAGESMCLLELGGQQIATGKIVQKKGRWYFQVNEINEVEDKEAAE